jgi:hypothetical protein
LAGPTNDPLHPKPAAIPGDNPALGCLLYKEEKKDEVGSLLLLYSLYSFSIFPFSLLFLFFLLFFSVFFFLLFCFPS